MRSPVLFRDRNRAGVRLAGVLASRLPAHLPIAIYALPRGGIPVALPVAAQLQQPLQVAIAKKIALPDDPELALGAVTPAGQTLWSPHLAARTLSSEDKAALTAAQQTAWEKATAQQELFAVVCPTAPTTGAIALLIDDGIATGLTLTAAVKAMQCQQFDEIWIAAPVAPEEFVREPPIPSDRCCILEVPTPFYNVGRFYREFPQVDSAEALSLLRQHNQPYLAAA